MRANRKPAPVPARPIRIALVLPLVAGLMAGCTAAGGATVFHGEVATYPERGNARCDNYARQTYYNALEDYSDRGEGFGTHLMTRQTAERMADRAYERCLSGRLN